MANDKKTIGTIDRYKDLSDENSELSISEMAKMISIFYDEIKSIAKNLEDDHYPLPQKDIIDLHTSFKDYVNMGNEFTERLKERVKRMPPPLSDIKTDSEIGTL